MAKEWEAFKYILKRSVERNGEKPLTNRWLLNICNMADRYVEHQSMAEEASMAQFWDEHHQWGSD